MSAYENVGHFKSSTASLGLHTHHHSQQMSHRAAQAARQRRWRVLLSIGLLLPALAAIIGIVAWTISIEVTNGAAQSEAAAQASALTSGQQQRRSLHPNQLTGAEHSKFQHHFRRRPQQPLEPNPEAAAVVAASGSPRRRNVQENGNQVEGSGELPAEPQQPPPPQQQQQQQQQQQPSSKSENGATLKAPIGQNDKQSAAVLLTNLEQVEALDKHHHRQREDDQDGSFPDEPDEEADAKPEPAKPHKQHKSAAWMVEDDKMANRRSRTSTHKELSARKMMKPESPAASSRKMISRLAAKQDRTLSARHKTKGLKVDSRYIILNEQRQVDEQQLDLMETSTPSPAPSTTTTVATTTTAQSATEPPIEAARSADDDDNSSSNNNDDDNGSSPADLSPEAVQVGKEEMSQFEAIASAISSSLSAATATDGARRQLDSLEGDTGVLPQAGGPVEATAEQRRPESSAAPAKQQRRSRTTGQHVADVIDHIVDQRRRNLLPSQQPARGPQIVVVAPVGGTDQAMKARSLTKSDSDSIDAKSIVASSKPISIISSKSAEQAKQPSKKEVLLEKQRRNKKPVKLGARLLGVAVGDSPAASDIKFSERVEVIEDDDSSALLFKQPEERADLDEPEESDGGKQRSDPLEESGSQNEDRQSSIHVASRPGQARSRTPRHELAASRQLERYAPLPVEPIKSDQGGPKLYSAEQLIRDAVIKSKSRPPTQRQLTPVAQNATQMPIAKQPTQPQQPQVQQQPAHQVKMAPTTLRPHQSATEQSSLRQARPENRQQQAPHLESQQAFGSEVQSVQVPLFLQQQPQLNQQQINQQQTYQQQESYLNGRLAAEASQLQPVRSMEPQVYPQQQQQQQQQQQHQQQMQLPQFADQEYNVPAHMAESVIQDLQRSPVGMLNGRPTLLNPMGFQQKLAEASHPQMTYHQHLVSQQQLYQQRHPMQQQQLYRAQQVLANREGADREPITIKASKSLVHPVAQMALRHLFSSLAGQQSQRQDGKEAMMLQAAGSAPPASAVPAPDASSRSMRSLSGDSPAVVAEPLEVQESYPGPQPAYQMAPYGGGQHYPSEHDKKSKGITFHFGGGPIGGGTQLITSPMGIFKHLMIPLMPNPRVNLNGKVVFGVVLEKSTAIGEPKKKYKFWG